MTSIDAGAAEQIEEVFILRRGPRERSGDIGVHRRRFFVELRQPALLT